MSRTALYSFMGTRGLRPRRVTVYSRTNRVGTLYDADRLAQVGDWIIECKTADDLFGRFQEVVLVSG